MENKYQAIVAIVNLGFADAVMDAARTCNAMGGTIINARGTASKESEQIFNITIQPEKEIVIIVVEEKIKDDVLHAIYKEVGLMGPGQGIAFSLPVDEVVGITNFKKSNSKKDKEAK